MTQSPIVIIDGVRFRQEDAARLGLKEGGRARSVPPGPLTTTAAQHTAQLAAQEAADTQAAREVVTQAQQEAAKIISDAHAAAAAIKEGAGNGGNVSGEAGRSGDDGEAAGGGPKGRASTKASK